MLSHTAHFDTISYDIRQNQDSTIPNTVRENVLRAKAIRSALDLYDLNNLIVNAQLIYQEGISSMRNQVEGTGIVPSFTAVVVEMNKVTGDDGIQHERKGLIATVKAHRIMTELMWVKLWKEEESIRQTTRDDILAITNKLKNSISSKAKDTDLLYEVESLEQAAKCLDPAGGAWSQFFIPTMTAAGAAVSSSFDNLFSSIYTLSTMIGKEWIDDWYVEMFPLKWISTSIQSIEIFDTIITPPLPIITDKGNMYTLTLVNILRVIFENPRSTEDLKERVFQELMKLVSIKPSYTLLGAIKHPNQMIDKIFNHPDRYTQTRSFAAMTLCDLGEQPGNEGLRTPIAITLREWNDRIKKKTSKKYRDEKMEMEKRLEEIEKNLDSLEKQKHLLTKQSYLTGESLDDKREREEIDSQIDAMNLKQIELDQAIQFANMVEKSEDEELELLNELSERIKGW